VVSLDETEIAQLDERLKAGRARDPNSPALVLEDQSRDRVSLAAEARAELTAISVQDEPWRNYPHGQLGAHLIGYMNHLTAKELEALEAQGYGPSEFIGRYGLERKFEHYLRGKKGIERYTVNAKGQRTDKGEDKGLIVGPRFVAPVAGHDVVLTLDLELQKLAERAVAQQAAAAVAVVEVSTGRVLALVSTPAFDPNVMTGKLTRAEEARMNADPRKPFIDKTLRQHYPPGSTFKFVTAAISVDDGLIDEHEKLSCPGYHMLGNRTFRCLHTHGAVDLLGAIQHSCNVFFWKLAERIGLDRIAEVAIDFGLGAPTGIGLNGDVSGRIPTRAWYEQRDTFKVGYTLNAATGQGDVEVTVLQMAMAYAAIANGGKLYVPQVVDRIQTASGKVVAS
jgi:penicillin-binding protein 2